MRSVVYFNQNGLRETLRMGKQEILIVQPKYFPDRTEILTELIFHLSLYSVKIGANSIFFICTMKFDIYRDPLLIHLSTRR